MGVSSMSDTGKRIMIIAVPALIMASAGSLWAASAAGEMRKGLEEMEEGRHLAASTNFLAAAELAAGQEREPALAFFNAGNALYRAGELERAEESYQRALDSDDLELQSRVFYNLGNILLKRSGAALKENEAKLALNLYERARAEYEKAIVLDPEYIDPKYNYELAGQRKYDLLSQVDQLRADMEKARRQARAAEYSAAFQLLQEKTPKHQLAFQLEPGLKKKYEELMKKIGDIAQIITQTGGGEDA